MDARILSFGDMVKYHNTILSFIGIARISDAYSAIYDGKYTVQAKIEDDSILPVPITEEFLEKKGFEWSLNDDGKEQYYNSKGSVSLIKDSLGFWIVDCFAYRIRNSIQEYSIKWVHELQSILRTCCRDEFARNLNS